MRRISRHIMGVMALVTGLLADSSEGAMPREAAAEKPIPTARVNFLFILVDDLGWRDLGSFGSTFYETPHLDRLCREGMKFTDAYAACPVCSPTRGSILSGRYPARNDTTDYFGAAQPEHWKRNTPMLPAQYREHLPLEEVTIPEALKASGYKTFFAGKWHLGHRPEFWPEAQGFDINKGGWAKGGPYGGKQYFSPYANPRLEDGPAGEHLPDRLATETVKFIEQSRDQPFFAYLSFYSVHTPLMSREDLKEKYLQKKRERGVEDRWVREGDRRVRQVQNHAVYAGMVEAMDQAVGKVLTALREQGLDETTVVMVMSDNGGLSSSEGSPTSNVPLRAGKGWMYEGGIREPMIIKWPGTTEAGSICAVPVTSTDFYPTILEVAGIPARPQQHVDGKSLAPLLKGQDMDRGPIYWHYPHYGNQGGSPAGAVRDGDWKLIEFYEDSRVELYNLSEDLGEKHDLASEVPEKAAELRALLHAWQKEVDAKMPAGNPAYRPGEPQ